MSLARGDSPLDLHLLRTYQGQVAYSCTAVLFGHQDITSGLGTGVATRDYDRLWYGIQNFIIGAGNASKALWGTGRNEAEAHRRYTERQPLRDSLGVTDDSPLRRVKIRNDYEHLDERIEEWWSESQHRNLVTLIGARSGIVGDVLEEKDVMRWFDPESGDIIFWGNELNVYAVTTEVQRLLPRAKAESEKPHWDEGSPLPRISGGP